MALAVNSRALTHEARKARPLVGAPKAGLIRERATSEHAGALRHDWQMPMYALDFRPIKLTREQLREMREASYPWDY